eukprot:6247775-Prymnesium_polylepis.1
MAGMDLDELEAFVANAIVSTEEEERKIKIPKWCPCFRYCMPKKRKQKHASDLEERRRKKSPVKAAVFKRAQSSALVHPAAEPKLSVRRNVTNVVNVARAFPTKPTTQCVQPAAPMIAPPSRRRRRSRPTR